MTERLEALRDNFRTNLQFRKGDLRDYGFVLNGLRSFQPDAIVHLGEMPSSPYSMIDVDHAVFTQMNNLIGTLYFLYAMKETCPQTHLVTSGFLDLLLAFLIRPLRFRIV